jgi:hypothetical protein
LHGIDDTQQHSHHKGKRRHRSSSDSSFLEAIVKPKLRKGETKAAPERREELVSNKAKKHEVVPSDSASLADSHVHHETFEKRERHKTREDRFEPKKKRHKSDKQDGTPKRKKKREKKGDKRQAAKKASEDLMNNFSSKSIAENRLTVSCSTQLLLIKLTSQDPSSWTWTIQKWPGIFSSSKTWP